MGSIVQGVKVENVDEDEKLHYKARALEIKIKNKNDTIKIETPTRFSNQQELNAKAWIPSEVPIISHAGVVDLRLNEKEINGLLNDNLTASRRLYSLKKAGNQFLHFPIKALLIQPTLSGMSGLKYLRKNPALVERFIRVSMQFAREAGFNTYIIPYLGLGVGEAKSLYRGLLGKEGDNLDITPAIDIGMKAKEFEQLLKHLKDSYINTGLINNITFLYKNYGSAPVSYDIAWEQLRDSNTMITLVGTERYMSGVGGVSSMHLSSFELGDAFSLKVNRPFFSQGKDTGEQRVNGLRIFDRDTLRVSRLLAVKGDVSKFSRLLEEIEAVYGRDKEFVKKAMENIEEAKTEDGKYDSIKAITKIHEFVESVSEFGSEAMFVKKRETKDYIKSKEGLEKAITDITKKK